ncbi:MAG: alpha/beta hydrolase [Chloroflexota bacterium]
MSNWTIRSLLNPVISRLLIYGVNPMDVEHVLTAVEAKPHLNASSLEKSWLAEWEKKAARYQALAGKAEQKGNHLSASIFYFYAAQCYYAVFLINFSDRELKKQNYLTYAQLYRKSVMHDAYPVERLDIPIGDALLPGYLHLPRQKSSQPSACTVIFSGLGSCKEEMHLLARPLVEHGVAAFVADMPGNGEALFERDIKCRYATIEAAFGKILDVLATRVDLHPDGFGAYGLCMGGGYAHRAVCIDRRYRYCVNLFPLFITQTVPDATPQWMKQGAWYDFQTGGLPAEDFMGEMKTLEEGAISCPYLFIHGKYDNWMTLDAATTFYERATGEKEKLVIEEVPVFSNQQVVTHTMPVGEQLHWVKHFAADWIAAHTP